MKKILTVSLFAMMAVSAANADIASTKFVTDRTGNTEFEGSVAQAADLTAAVNALAGKVDTVAGSGEGSVSDQINSALANYTNTTGMNSAIDAAKQAAIDDAKKYIDADELAASQNAQNETLNTAIDAKQTKALVTSIGEGSLDTTYPSAKAVYDHVESEMGALNEDLGGLQTTINNTQSGLTGLADEFDAYQTSNNAAVAAAKTQADKGVADAAAAKSAADAADSKAQGAVDTNATQQTAIDKNASDIAGINNTTTGILAQAKSYADAEDKKIEDTIGTVEQGKTVVQMITEASGDAGAVAEDLADYIASNNTAVAAAKTQADKGVADAAKAQGEVDALEGVVAQQKTDLQQAISDGDATTLAAAKADAESKANAAKDAAIDAAKTAGDAAYAAKSYEGRVAANETAISKIDIAAAGVLAAGEGDGQYALTMTKSGNNLTYKWEVIGR